MALGHTVTISSVQKITQHYVKPSPKKQILYYFLLPKICLGAGFLKAHICFVLVFFICCQK